MPNELQHVQWAIHSYDVMEHLSKYPTFCDWMATVAFYSALHIVDGVLFRQEDRSSLRHGIGHDKRRRILKSRSKYRTLYTNYQKLFEHSQVARYLKPKHGRVMFFQQYMSFETVITVALGQQLKAIISAATTLVSTASKAELISLRNRIDTLVSTTAQSAITD